MKVDDVVRDLMAACDSLMSEVCHNGTTNWVVVNDAMVEGRRYLMAAPARTLHEPDTLSALRDCAEALADAHDPDSPNHSGMAFCQCTVAVAYRHAHAAIKAASNISTEQAKGGESPT